jgi:SAM-dependent methyltransferase
MPDRHYDAMSFAVRRIRARRDDISVHTAFERRFVSRYGATVRGGPFAGLIYDPRVIGHTTAVAAKLLGAYERELHPAVERTLASDMSRFVDIGCAEGYYAVGVACRRRDVRVVGFDIDPAARRMCRILAGINGVSVDVRSEASRDYLRSLARGTVVFSDCEGAESHLLDPEQVPSLSQLPIIVELHDFLDPMVSATIRSRFAASHVVEEVTTSPRDPAIYSELAVFPETERDLALSEGRPTAMSWFVMRPR